MIYREYLEAEIISSCNLSCKDCSHHSPFIKRDIYFLNEFRTDLGLLSKVLRVNEFRLLGGEPLLLSKSILEYVTILRNSNITSKIGICTNGLLLNKIDHDLLDSIDFLDISVYPINPKVNHALETQIKRLTDLNHQKIRLMRRNEFRYTSLLVENTNEELVRQIWEKCRIKNRCHAIYRGYYLKCMPSRRKGEFIENLTGVCVPYLHEPSDYGVELASENLENTLHYFLQDANPLSACKWCMGTSGKKTKHIQTRDKTHMIDNIGNMHNYLDI